MRLIISLALIAALFASAFAVEIPDSFDARDKWPKCITPILNQGQCGSCWSFSASTSMSARFCIATNGTFKAQTVLSPQYLINCDTDDQGACQGGDTLAAYNFMKMSGQDTLNCTKYVSGETTEAGSCPTTCDDGRAIDNKQLFFGVDAYSLVVPGDNAATVQRMQQELMKNGPLSVSFVVYQDFIPFFKQNPKGIYTRTTGRALGGHAVRLVGWGEENKQKYWIIANSWGPEFGFDGYFKIARGVDLATIESRRVTAGIPRVNADVKPVIRDSAKALIIDGGKVKVPVDDEILEIAKFSLSEMNQKKNGPDAFYGVDEVFAQVTNGITYHLKLSVGNASRRKFDSVAEPELISVVVHRNHNDKLTLKSL